MLFPDKAAVEWLSLPSLFPVAIMKPHTALNSRESVAPGSSPGVSIKGLQVGAGPTRDSHGVASLQQIILQCCSVGQGHLHASQMGYEGPGMILRFLPTCSDLTRQSIQNPHLQATPRLQMAQQ